MQLIDHDNNQIYNLYLEMTEGHLAHLKHAMIHGYIRKGVVHNYTFYYVPTVHYDYRYNEREINVPYRIVWNCAYTYLYNLINNKGIESLPERFLGLALLFGYDNLPLNVAIHFAYSVKIQKDTKCIEIISTTTWIGEPTRGESVADIRKELKEYLDYDKILSFTINPDRTTTTINPRIKFHDNVFVGGNSYKQHGKLVDIIDQKEYYPILQPQTLKFVNTGDTGSQDCVQLFSFGGRD